MTHFVEDVKDIWRLACPYFQRKTTRRDQAVVRRSCSPAGDAGSASAFSLSVVSLEAGSSYFSKLLNNWSQGFGDAIQEKNWGNFLGSLWQLVLIFAPYIWFMSIIVT